MITCFPHPFRTSTPSIPLFKLCVYHPGVFFKLNKIGQFLVKHTLLFLLVYLIYYMGDMFRLSVSHHQALLLYKNTDL